MGNGTLTKTYRNVEIHVDEGVKSFAAAPCSSEVHDGMLTLNEKDKAKLSGPHSSQLTEEVIRQSSSCTAPPPPPPQQRSAPGVGTQGRGEVLCGAR
ncbi:hypothetical protein U0070_014116 [Myodes glareolus]|uniref:Uncharacterized protein n=1 Tax=Myodes glareolus TaxID=447135 RepID=A0AAW0JDK4_MYOGA